MNEEEAAVEGLLNQSLCTSGLSLGDLQACNDENPDAYSRDSLLSTLAELAACSSGAATTTIGHVSTTPSKMTRSPNVVVTTHQAFDGDEILSLNELPSCSAVQMGIDQVAPSDIFTSDSLPICSTGLTAIDQPTDLAFLNANNLPSYTMNEVNIGPRTVFVNTIDGLPTCSSGQTIDTRPTGGDGQVVIPQHNPTTMIPVSGTDPVNAGERTQSFLLVIKNAPISITDDLINTPNVSAMPSTVFNMLPSASVADEPLYTVSNTALGLTMATSSADNPARTLASTYAGQISLQDLPARAHPQVVVAHDFVDALDHVDRIKEGNVAQFQTTNASQLPMNCSTTISQPNTFYQQMDRLIVQTDAMNESQFVPENGGVDGNRLEDFGRCVEISTTENCPPEECQAFVPALSNRPRDFSSDIDRLCETVLAGSDLGPLTISTCKGLPILDEGRQTNVSNNDNVCRPGDMELVTKIINCQQCAQVSQNIIDLGISGTKVCLFIQKQGHLLFLCISELISKKILPSAPVLRDTLFAYNVRLRHRLTSDECHYVEHQNVFPLNAYYQPMKIRLEQLVTLSNFLCRTGHVYNRKLLEELIATPFYSGIKCAQREAQLKDWINNKIPFETQEVAGIHNLVVVTSDKVKYILLSQLYNRHILQRKHHLTTMSLCKNLQIKMCQLSMTDWKVFRKYAGGRERILIDVEGLLSLCHVFYLFIMTLNVQAHRELIEVIKKNPRKKLLDSSTEAEIVLMNQAVSKEIEISGELFVKKLKKDEMLSMSACRQMQKKAERQQLITKMSRNVKLGKSMTLPVKMPQVIETTDHLSNAKKTYIRVNTALPAGTYCVDENTLVPAEEMYNGNGGTTSSPKPSARRGRQKAVLEAESSPKPSARRGRRKAVLEAESAVSDTATIIFPEDITSISHFKANVSPKQTRVGKKRGPKKTNFSKAMLSKIANAHAENIRTCSGNQKQLLEISDFDVDTAVADEREMFVIESSAHQKKPKDVTISDLRQQLYGSPERSKKYKGKKKMKGKAAVSPIGNSKNTSDAPSPQQGQKKSKYSNVIADVLKRYQKVVSNRQTPKQVVNHIDEADCEEYGDAAPVTEPRLSQSSLAKSTNVHSVIKSNIAISMPDCNNDAIDNESKIAAEILTAQSWTKSNDVAPQNVTANVSQTVDEHETDASLRVNKEYQMIWDKAHACKAIASPVKDLKVYPIKDLKASPIKGINTSIRSLNASPVKSLNVSLIKTCNATPIKSLNASPVKSINASPIKSLNAAPVTGLNASPIKSLNAAITSLNASPVKRWNAASVTSLNASPIKSLNASPVKSINAPPIKSLNAAPVTSLNAPPINSLNAAPVTSLNASPVKSLNAAPVTGFNATPVKSLNAAPVTGFNASPIKSLNAAPVTSLNASPVKSMNAAPVTSLNASPVKSLNAAPVTSLNASPVKRLNAAPVTSLNASPVKRLNAAPVTSLNAAPVTSLNASPVKRLIAAPITSLNASPVKSLNAAPVTSLNASPVKCLNASPIKILNVAPIMSLNAAPKKILNATTIASSNTALVKTLNAAPMNSLIAAPKKTLNATPMERTNAPQIKSLKASSMKSANAASMETLNATPLKILSANTAPIKTLNAAPMNSSKAPPVKCKNASPVICKKIPEILLSKSPDVRKICSNTLIVSLSQVKMQGGRTKITDSGGISHGSANFHPRIQAICSLPATDPLAPSSAVPQEATTQTIISSTPSNTVPQEPTTQTMSCTPTLSNTVLQEQTTQTMSSTPTLSNTVLQEPTMQIIARTPARNDSQTNRTSVAKSFLCSPVKRGNSSTDLQSRLADIDCNDSLQFLASVAEVLTDSADDVNVFIQSPVEETISRDVNHLPTQAPKVICQTLASDVIGGNVQTSEINSRPLHGNKKKNCKKSKRKPSKDTGTGISPSPNVYVSEWLDGIQSKDSTPECENDDIVEQVPNAISAKSLLINLLSVSKFTSDTNGVKFRVYFKAEAFQPIATPSGILDLRVKKQRNAFLKRFGCFVCRKYEAYHAKKIDINDQISLSSPPQKTAAKQKTTPDASLVKKQPHADDKSSGFSDSKCLTGANIVDKNDENKVRLKSGKRKRKSVKENSDDIVLQPEMKRRKLKRQSK